MKPCKGGEHSLVEIYRTYGGYFQGDTVVRWCQYCGGVVVDAEFDGRVFPGRVREMEFPEVAKARL